VHLFPFPYFALKENESVKTPKRESQAGTLRRKFRPDRNFLFRAKARWFYGSQGEYQKRKRLGRESPRLRQEGNAIWQRGRMK
jgi:hypothetical protein